MNDTRFAQIVIAHSENNPKRKDGVSDTNIIIKVEESKVFFSFVERVDAE